MQVLEHGLNRIRNPAGFEASRRIGELLANLTADLCLYQLEHNRHFLVENPLPSELWSLPKWVRLRAHPSACETTQDQCTVGLCDPEGHLTMKSTKLVASHPCLIKRLNKRCKRDHPHVQLAGNVRGVSRCRFAQAWPRRMVELIVDGIQELFREMKLPTYVAKTRRFECPGCNVNAARHDNRHNRGTDCRFPYDVATEWHCSSCKSHKASTHAGHTFEVGDCQWATSNTRTHVNGRQPRNPRVPENLNRDAAEDSHEPTHPAAVNGVEWTPVTNLETLTWLDMVRERDGWHTAAGNMTLVETNCRRLRSCEPRLDARTYEWRSVYGMFPECSHAHGIWHQLEQHVLFTDPSFDAAALLQPPVPICVMIFHNQSGEATPTINKTRPTLKPTAKPMPKNPFQRVMQEWEEEELGEATPGSRAKPSAEAVAAEHDGEVDPPLISENAEEIGEDIPVPEPDWTSWDLGRVLRALRSDVPGQKTRALRKLHTRWFHCSSTRMINMLRAAGVDKQTLDAIPGVVDTCKACRLWKRPTNKPVTGSRISTRFNECVQIDILFLADGIVLHAIDEATRFTLAGLIPDKTPASIQEWLMTNWVRYFGPPKVVLSDQEGALCSDESAVWCERQNIELRLRPKHSHAAVVERHHEILRIQINKIKSQCVSSPPPLTHNIGSSVCKEQLDVDRRLLSIHRCFWCCPTVSNRA